MISSFCIIYSSVAYLYCSILWFCSSHFYLILSNFAIDSYSLFILAISHYNLSMIKSWSYSFSIPHLPFIKSVKEGVSSSLSPNSSENDVYSRCSSLGFPKHIEPSLSSYSSSIADKFRTFSSF